MAVLGSLRINLQGAATGIEATLSRTEARMEKFARRAQQIGTSVTIGITAPIVAVGLGAVSAASEFEDAFTGVQKTVDATEGQFAILRQGIVQMSREIPASTTEISRVAEAAGQLGIETGNILGFTRTMIDLGNTTNLSAEQAATALARFANITQLPQDQFENLGSAIVNLGNNLAANEAEITEFGLRIAGAGNQIGLTQAEILSFGAALASVGIRAEAGGTAISTVFLEVAKSVELGGKKLDTFAATAGMSTAQFKAAFKEDAAGALITFIEGLDKVQKAGGSTIQTLEALGLADRRVRDALLRAAGAGDLFRKSLALGSDGFNRNIALAKESALRYRTFSSQVTLLRNRLKATVVLVGESLLPVFLELINAATPLIGGFARIGKAFSKLTADTRKKVVIFAGLFAASGPIIFAVSAFVAALGPLLLNPVVLIFGGLVLAGNMFLKRWRGLFRDAATIASFFAEQARKLGFKVSDSFAGFAEKMADSFTTLSNAETQDFLNALPEGIRNLKFEADSFGLSVEELEAKLKSMTDVAGIGLENVAAKAAETKMATTNAVDAMLQKFRQLPQATQAIAQNLEDSIVNFAETGKFAFKDFVNSAIKDLIRLAVRGAILGIFTGGGPSPLAFFGGSFGKFGSSLPGFANGGFPKANRPAVVGENGPELFMPGRRGAIIPNDMAGGGPAQVTQIIKLEVPRGALEDAAAGRSFLRAAAEALKEETPEAVEFATRVGDTIDLTDRAA